MTNIRIVRLSVTSSSLIEVTFTDSLSSDVGINNIELKSLSGVNEDPIILSTSVEEKKLKIYLRPLVARAYYRFILFSTDSQPVIGAKGEYFIEDGSTNVIFFVGPQEDNLIRDEILSNLPGIYDI